jgi:hypothetical protein
MDEVLFPKTKTELERKKISRIMNRTFLKKPDNKARHPRFP